MSGGFQFTTSNFDDGWVSNAKAEWAEVTKGNIKVLVHYPNKQADEYIPDLDKATANGWNVLVAPRYASASNMALKPVSGYGSVQFTEADMVEKGTGRTVHVVLFQKHPATASGVYIEFITPDKATFEKEFGAWHNTTDGWERMDRMATYNRFAVAASDLRGKWTTNFAGTTHYVNAYTGNFSGMSSYASRRVFVFGSGQTYNWELATAGGSTGNIKFDGVRSSGKFTMNGYWQVNFSDIEKKPKTYNVYFSCIRGGLRILWMDGQAYGKEE